MHTRFVDGHHIQHRADGGETRRPNLALICRLYHRLVQQVIERLMERRTTVITAHRPATVLKADRIVLIDRGRIIIDVGTHDELIQRAPLYARLAELQFGSMQDAA